MAARQPPAADPQGRARLCVSGGRSPPPPPPSQADPALSVAPHPASRSCPLQIHSDSDEGDGSIKYTISGEGAGTIFLIDELTGDIHATERLDREQKTFYTLRAQARDRQTDRLLEPESEFVIKVQDINDSEPRFLGGPFIGSVAELSPIGESPSPPHRDPAALGSGLQRLSVEGPLSVGPASRQAMKLCLGPWQTLLAFRVRGARDPTLGPSGPLAGLSLQGKGLCLSTRDQAAFGGQPICPTPCPTRSGVCFRHSGNEGHAGL